jgi:hypothetical protein
MTERTRTNLRLPLPAPEHMHYGLAAVAGPAERTRMAQHYRDSSRYELLFWEAALEREIWPVKMVA